MSDPSTFWLRGARLWMAVAETAAHAGLTIAARSAMLGTAALRGRAPPLAELTRMVVEKQAAALAATAGAVEPYRRATRANARRLSRRRRD